MPSSPHASGHAPYDGGPLDGGCLCGALRYVIRPPFNRVDYCHCHICQQAHGAPMVAWVTLPPDQFAYTQGHAHVYSSSETAQREFCPVCGSPVLFRSLISPVVGIPVTSLDTPDVLHPQCHVWTSSRRIWMPDHDGLPQFPQEPPEGWSVKDQ